MTVLTVLYGCSASVTIEADQEGVRGALTVVSGSNISTKDDSDDSSRPGDSVSSRLSLSSALSLSSVAQRVFDSEFSDYSVLGSYEGGPFSFDPLDYTSEADLYYRSHYLAPGTYFEEYFTTSTRSEESLHAIEFYRYSAADSVGDEGEYISKVYDASGSLVRSIEDSFTLESSTTTGGEVTETTSGTSVQATPIYQGNISYTETSRQSAEWGAAYWYAFDYVSSGNITYIEGSSTLFNLYFESEQRYDSREVTSALVFGDLEFDFTISVPRSDKVYEFVTSVDESSIDWDLGVMQGDLFESDNLVTPVARFQLSLTDSQITIYMMDSDGNVEATPL
jgi:hypothetical protein